jgi:Xaa-Pro aminopeptidase
MLSPLTELRRKLKEKGLDAFLVTKEQNVSHVSGFSGQESYLLISHKRNWFITDFRYMEQARKETKGYEIIGRKDSWTKVLAELVASARIKNLGFESESITFEEYNRISSLIRGIRLTPVKGLIEEIREIKSHSEIKIIRHAVKLACETHEFLKGFIRPGISEMEVASEAEYFIRKSGGEKSAFDTIVAAGSHASQPHARASRRKLANAGTIIIDLGIRYQGYNSDLTRTLFLGKMPVKARKVYDTVLTAQDKALRLIKPGVRISAVDRAARDFISKNGYGKFFGHALGHGVGREIHELPRISSGEKKALREGMVFTVEPGIYIPGWGGVRIEDMVVVTDKGCEVLSGNLNKSV